MAILNRNSIIPRGLGRRTPAAAGTTTEGLPLTAVENAALRKAATAAWRGGQADIAHIRMPRQIPPTARSILCRAIPLHARMRRARPAIRSRRAACAARVPGFPGRGDPAMRLINSSRHGLGLAVRAVASGWRRGQNRCPDSVPRQKRLWACPTPDLPQDQGVTLQDAAKACAPPPPDFAGRSDHRNR